MVANFVLNSLLNKIEPKIKCNKLYFLTKNHQFFILSFNLFILLQNHNGGASAKEVKSIQDNDRLVRPLVSSRSQIMAQVPDPITPRERDEVVPIPKTPPETELETPNITPPPSQLPDDVSQTVTVKQFQFEGNTVFTEEELQAEIREYRDRPITFAELLAVEQKITNKYVNAGYINSGAIIPDRQTFTQDNAVIKIQIIEGGIETIEVTGTDRLDPDYIRSRVALGTERPLNRNNLLEALQLLQLNPLVENISADLSVGSKVDTSILSVKVQEADSFHIDVFLDNNRVPSVGSFRRGIRLNEGNVFGIGDEFTMQYSNTDGSNNVDLSYAIPLSADEQILTIKGGISETSIIEEPFDRLDIEGSSFYIDLGFRQPIIRTPTQEFSLGFTLSRQESRTTLLGEDFPLSASADEFGQTKITALRLFQEFTTRSNNDVFALFSQFSIGLPIFGSTDNDTEADSEFFAWRGQAQYVRVIADDTLLVFRTDLQLAFTDLVGFEQFGLGGGQSVRGYRQDLLLTDNALLTSAEVRIPLLRKGENLLQVIPFMDFGVGWNRSKDDPDPNNIFGIGLGLLYQMDDSITARFDWGVDLTDTGEQTDETLQEQGFYFSVNYRF
jgi:hemolysin activation/secretion protein